MSVTVKTGEEFRALLGGKRQVTAEGETVGGILEYLYIRDRICDDKGRVWRYFNIHVNNGEEIRYLQGLDTPVEDGDIVTILSAIAGG